MKQTLMALLIAAAATPAFCGTNPLIGCAGPPIHNTYEEAAKESASTGPVYHAGTCECLSHKLGWHLDDWPGQHGCVFQSPPASFNPDQASVAELINWGIPGEDAAELNDPKIRQVYFQHVKHYVSGEGCDHSGCLPGISSGLDGLPGFELLCTRSAGELGKYCWHSDFLRGPRLTLSPP